jgi:DNA-binding Xre family transcriptional regulator
MFTTHHSRLPCWPGHKNSAKCFHFGAVSSTTETTRERKSRPSNGPLDQIHVAKIKRRLPSLFRSVAKLTRETSAEKTGLSVVFVSLLENGHRTVSVDALLRIAKALGVRIRDLVDEL